VQCLSFRERCDEHGEWLKEDFACAIDITGAEEQAIACAVNSQGRIVCFGPTVDHFSDELIAQAPKRTWAKLVLADDPLDVRHHQLCGIDIHGQGMCWNRAGESTSISGPVKQIALGTAGMCAVLDNGTGYCQLDERVIGPTPPMTGPVQDLLLRNDSAFGLQQDGAVTVPYPDFSPPMGEYTRISASDLELCAVRVDHTLSCAPHVLPPALASKHFIQVAVEYFGGMCAIRDDRTIVCDALESGREFKPPAGEFTRIAAVSAGMCAIRADGSLACFGETELVPPADW